MIIQAEEKGQPELGGRHVESLVGGLNAKYIHSSLALYTLAAACREAGHEVEVAEYTINQEFLYVLGEICTETVDSGFLLLYLEQEMFF